MRVESDAELMAFFSPAEFGEDAILRTATGDHPVTGHPDTMADSAKPAGIQNSSRSAFVTGAAEFTIREIQYMTATKLVHDAAAKLDDRLIIQTGTLAGTYRIKDINEDGGITRLLLNRV